MQDIATEHGKCECPFLIHNLVHTCPSAIRYSDTNLCTVHIPRYRICRWVLIVDEGHVPAHCKAAYTTGLAHVCMHVHQG